MTDMQKKLLWPTPIYKFHLGLSQLENNQLFELLSDEKYSSRNITAGGKDFPHTIDNTLIKKLYTRIEDCLNVCVRDIYPESYKHNITMSWVHCQNPGKILEIHSHPMVNLIATYYVRVPERSGDLILIDPRGGHGCFNKVDGQNYSTVFEEIHTQEGSLVIFPGHLLHEVRRNESNMTRMCIAHNIKCTI